MGNVTKRLRKVCLIKSRGVMYTIAYKHVSRFEHIAHFGTMVSIKRFFNIGLLRDRKNLKWPRKGMIDHLMALNVTCYLSCTCIESVQDRFVKLLKPSLSHTASSNTSIISSYAKLIVFHVGNHLEPRRPRCIVLFKLINVSL